MGPEKIKSRYRDRVDSFSLLLKKEERLLIGLSVLRLITFFAGIAVIWAGFRMSSVIGILFVLLTLTGFFSLLKLYSFHVDRKEYYSNLITINRNELSAMNGDFSVFDSGSSYIDKSHDYSFDIDLFGESSLFQYLNRTVTGYGRDILASWLSDPHELSREMKNRQDAIRELAEKDDWRHGFLAAGMKGPFDKSHIADMLNWISDSKDYSESFIKRIIIWVLPVLTIIFLFFTVTGTLHYSFFVSLILLNLFIITAGLRRANRIHRVVSRKYEYLSSLNEMLTMFEGEVFSSDILNNIKRGISDDDYSAAVSVRKLGRIIQAFDTRLNMLLGVILNGFFLWDCHCIYRLERWKHLNRRLFPVWLDMLGRVDAFISLGNYTYNNPGFAFPVISDGDNVFYAEELGHQLIEKERRVCNDFSPGPSGTVTIISGANMAGKSTFLRMVAVNYLLGMAGAPVCAKRMIFTPMRLFTSMRTTDSLSKNESYFYAELKRLKMLKSRISDGEQLFFILDEILKGTNSADKSRGSVLFLRRVVELGGTGLIATHDLTLCKLEDKYPGVIRNNCFEIEINGEEIIFDYKLHNGITHKMNASILMKEMNILD